MTTAEIFIQLEAESVDVLEDIVDALELILGYMTSQVIVQSRTSVEQPGHWNDRWGK